MTQIDTPLTQAEQPATTKKAPVSKDAPKVEDLEIQASVGSPLGNIDGVFFSGDPFVNWGKNLSNQPESTFYPNKLEDLKVIVREARANNKKIRCAGTGHSWCTSSITDGYLVSVNGMNKIHPPEETNHGWSVRIESGVTIAELDLSLKAHNPPLAISTSPLPTSVRYGGVLSMGCHGPTINASTMSDLITEIAILNGEGNLVTYSEEKDPQAFNAACVNLGLLGIIYTVTLRVEVMSTRLRVRDSNPSFLDFLELPDASVRLQDRIKKLDGFEVLYWPFKGFMKPEQNRNIWVKEWEKTSEPAEKENPNLTRSAMVDNPFFSEFFVGERVQEIPDALHFHFGDGVTTIVDAGAGFKVDPDFKNVISAFKELVDQNWAFTTSMPERMGTVLEFRIIKASNKIMSPVYDEDPEAFYCMINVMAASGTPGFEEYSKEVFNHWIEKYNARPHWPKLWENVPGIFTHLRREMGDRLVQFNRVRKAQDPNDMFLNDIWNSLLHDL
ncbi:hypothetical protein BGZ76_000008 [Entomortierella beljakovae]|nr:hypothetical protein BGZ76_000008 [Entomortierella beljakovae]